MCNHSCIKCTDTKALQPHGTCAFPPHTHPDAIAKSVKWARSMVWCLQIVPTALVYGVACIYLQLVARLTPSYPLVKACTYAWCGWIGEIPRSGVAGNSWSCITSLHAAFALLLTATSNS